MKLTERGGQIQPKFTSKHQCGAFPCGDRSGDITTEVVGADQVRPGDLAEWGGNENLRDLRDKIGCMAQIKTGFNQSLANCRLKLGKGEETRLELLGSGATLSDRPLPEGESLLKGHLCRSGRPRTQLGEATCGEPLEPSSVHFALMNEQTIAPVSPRDVVRRSRRPTSASWLRRRAMYRRRFFLADSGGSSHNDRKRYATDTARPSSSRSAASTPLTGDDWIATDLSAVSI